ncbi:hypothetical protein BGX29_002721 [Mortierella sp. GBA35]|nr:hypothetical protein BGX29_002721 [Mortierella sp. GBA35]
MFSGFSAWFAPELRSYRETWVKHGGEEKELAEADIAFVTNKTTFGQTSHKPTMKILRPDWIEDSIRGQKRLSLKRYKSVFPGLQRFDSGEHSNMAVGMDAYNSTNVITVEKSWPLHQPEPELQDLSVTPSSGASHRMPATQGGVSVTQASSSLHQNRSVIATPGSVRTITLTKSDNEQAEEEGEGDDEYEQDEEMVDARATFLEQRSQSDEDYEPSEQDPLSTTGSMGSTKEEYTSPEAPPRSPPKRRRLPETLMEVYRSSRRRANRPPARTHSSQVSEPFFTSSGSEDEMTTDQKDDISNDGAESSTSHQRDDCIGAEDYLRHILEQMGEGSKQLLSTRPCQVKLIDIDSVNITLRRK